MSEEAQSYILNKHKFKEGSQKTDGSFTGGTIRALVKDEEFLAILLEQEIIAMKALEATLSGFFGNHKADNFEELVQNLLNSMNSLGSKMTVKVHVIDSHLDRFPKNVGHCSDEQGEALHQDWAEHQERYKGHDLVSMMADILYSSYPILSE